MQDAKLTAKQEKWVTEYLACGNASASAVKAGFSSRGAGVAGNRMLRNANVQKALKARQTADAARLSIQREDVLAGLLAAVDTARRQQNPMAMISGLREVGKMLGFYAVQTKRAELAVEGEGAMANLRRLSDDELTKIMAMGQPVAR